MTFRWLLFLPLLALLAGCAAPGGSTSGGAGTGAPNVYLARESRDIAKVGILPFKAATSLIGESVSDQFVTEMMKLTRYELVERAQMSGVLGETEVALSGLTAGQAAQLGQMAGAQAVILGTVSEYETVALGGRSYPVVGITIRLVDCGTGRILWSVDHAARGKRSDTLAQHSRKVVHDMAVALNRHLR